MHTYAEKRILIMETAMKVGKILSGITALLLAANVWAGEFGDHCTTGLSKGSLIRTTCEIKELYKGKTYCFGNESAKNSFLLDPDSTIAKAAAFYDKNKEPEREKISQADVLKEVESKTCDLSSKDAGYLELDGKDLRHCKMVNTSFFGAYLRGANLSGANLQGAYLNLARLENANFSGANLQDATIFQAIFENTNFKGANLSNARMIGTLTGLDMSEAVIKKGRYGLDIGNQPMGAMRFEAIGGKFANTDFEGSDINRANFRFADLSNTNLRNTDLFRADFSKANLTGADITGANMNEAILDETIMTNVKGLQSIAGYDISKGKCIDCMVTDVKTASAIENKEMSTETKVAKSETFCPFHNRPIK